MVLIKVDFPKPVWPVQTSACNVLPYAPRSVARTNTDHVELEAPFKKLALDLICDAVEADMALGHYRVLQRGQDVRGGHIVTRPIRSIDCTVGLSH